MMGKIDVINSTLGKALGGASGGYTTGPRELISVLRQKSRPYLFSNSLPPPVVAVASKVNFSVEPVFEFLKRCQCRLSYPLSRELPKRPIRRFENLSLKMIL